MVRRARGEKGNKGEPPFRGERSERRNLLRRMLPDTSLSNMNLPICQRTLKPSHDRFRRQRYNKQNPES
jgi:hypothetical protein